MKFLKSNYKLFIGIIIGILISGGVVYASQQLLAINVSYDNSTSGLQATNAQDAIDELNTKANTLINPEDIKAGGSQRMFSSPSGVCINRSGKVYCFRPSNFIEEKEHMQEVFSDISCSVSSSSVYCNASDFLCETYSNGNVSCTDRNGGWQCSSWSNGYVNCT